MEKKSFFVCFLGTFRTMGTAVQCLRIPRRISDPNLYTCFRMVRALEKKKIINTIVACTLGICKLQRTSRNIWSRVLYNTFCSSIRGGSEFTRETKQIVFFLGRSLVAQFAQWRQLLFSTSGMPARSDSRPRTKQYIFSVLGTQVCRVFHLFFCFLRSGEYSPACRGRTAPCWPGRGRCPPSCGLPWK